MAVLLARAVLLAKVVLLARLLLLARVVLISYIYYKHFSNKGWGRRGNRRFPYICTICESVYTTYKNTTTENCKVEAPHCRCGCLWWDYFREKLIYKNPTFVFIVGKHVK
jgi:hypothetical protein